MCIGCWLVGWLESYLQCTVRIVTAVRCFHHTANNISVDGRLLSHATRDTQTHQHTHAHANAPSILIPSSRVSAPASRIFSIPCPSTPTATSHVRPQARTFTRTNTFLAEALMLQGRVVFLGRATSLCSRRCGGCAIMDVTKNHAENKSPRRV